MKQKQSPAYMGASRLQKPVHIELGESQRSAIGLIVRTDGALGPEATALLLQKAGNPLPF